MKIWVDLCFVTTGSSLVSSQVQVFFVPIFYTPYPLETILCIHYVKTADFGSENWNAWYVLCLCNSLFNYEHCAKLCKAI